MCPQDMNDMEGRILEAAKRVFVRKGYEQTSMSDIANEVGISRTALHYYFRTKQMLFEAIFGQLLHTLLPNIKKIVELKISILEKIPLIIDEYSGVLCNNMLFPIFVVNEMNRDPEHLYQTILKDPTLIQPLLQLKEQVEDEMERGLLKRVVIIDVLCTIISNIVFPFLLRNPLSAIFLENDQERFEQYVKERTPFVKNLANLLLAPSN
ncbi:TetR/AcrR family transcriptional regulator [Parabacteroides sp. OttesenSCG-928-G07]|nr:TetR/AcrR family transcriptional regulator [Parabacteroides sp. OttesenSCG-928-G07]